MDWLHRRQSVSAESLTPGQVEQSRVDRAIDALVAARSRDPACVGGLTRRLRTGLLTMDAAVFELSALEALDVRREDVPRDLPPWMRRRSVLRCALGVLLPSATPVFKDYALFRKAPARSTGSAIPSGYRQTALLRAHLSVTDPEPRWRDLEPLNRGQRMMRDAKKPPPLDMAPGPSFATRRVLDLAGQRQPVTVRVYLTVARFAAAAFFPRFEKDEELYHPERARLLAVTSGLDVLRTAAARRERLRHDAMSAGAAVAGTARRFGDALSDGARTAKTKLVTQGDSRVQAAMAGRGSKKEQQEQARMRDLRRKGLLHRPEDLPDDAPLIDSQRLFRKPAEAPLRSSDAVFARVHLRDKSVQGTARRAVLVPRGTTGRQVGFEVRRAEGAAGGEADAAEVDVHQCFELEAALPSTALLVVELFRQTVPEAPLDEDGRPGEAPPAEVSFVGGCVIDLEHRWLHPAWQNMAHGRNPDKLPPLPIETRLLRSTDGGPAGSLQMWCDMLTKPRAALNPPLVIAPPPPVAMELRVTVWRVRGMEQLGWDATKEGRKGGHVPFFVRGWMHDQGFDYRAVSAMAGVDGGADLVEYPGEQRTSTGVAIPCGEAAELADDVEVQRGADAKNDFAASACATIGEMGFVPPLFFAKVADAMQRREDAKAAGRPARPKREARTAPAKAAEPAAAGVGVAASASSASGAPAAAAGGRATPTAAAAVASSASPAAGAKSPGFGAGVVDAMASAEIGKAEAEAAGPEPVEVAASELSEMREDQAEAAAEDAAKRYLPTSMWPGGGGPRPEDRVLPQATHAAFNWRMTFPVTHQRWGRLPVPGPLVMEVCEGLAPRPFTREHAEAVEAKSVGCCRSLALGCCTCCRCVGAASAVDVPVTPMDACGLNTAQACGATRWRGRGACVIDFTRAVKLCSQHPDTRTLVVPGPGYKGVSNAQKAMAWVPVQLARHSDDKDGEAAVATDGTTDADADAALDQARERLRPHSLQPAVLISVELVPLAASTDFAKEHQGRRPGLGREEPNDDPYLKDPGAILRQIEATRRKNRKRRCCSVM